MKKIIIGLLLMAIAIFAVFSYKQYTVKNEKLAFSNAIGKEYIYLKDGVKSDITLTFSNDGLFGFAGVNRYFAGYKIDGANIKFSPVGSTMMAGPQDKMDEERQYFDLLNTVDKIEVYKNKIVLTTNDNQKLSFTENDKNINNIIVAPTVEVQEPTLETIGDSVDVDANQELEI